MLIVFVATDEELTEMVQTNPALLAQLPPDYQVRFPSFPLLLHPVPYKAPSPTPPTSQCHFSLLLGIPMP
jgi:hypothetical protein